MDEGFFFFFLQSPFKASAARLEDDPPDIYIYKKREVQSKNPGLQFGHSGATRLRDFLPFCRKKEEKKRKKEKNQDVVWRLSGCDVWMLPPLENAIASRRDTRRGGLKKKKKKKQKKKNKKRERGEKKKQNKKKNKTAPCPQVFGSGLADGWLIQRLRAELRRARAT